MQQNNSYRLATALLSFRHAYAELTAASIAMGDDYDMSEYYPFYILDFEEIAPAVDQWAVVQAEKLLRMLPDMVINPACLACHANAVIILEHDGSCSEATSKSCINYPYIPFTAALCIPILKTYNMYAQSMSDAEVELAYINLCNKLVEVKDQ